MLDKFCHALECAQFPAQKAFQPGATSWSNLEHNCNVWLFPTKHFPGPRDSCFARATDQQKGSRDWQNWILSIHRSTKNIDNVFCSGLLTPTTKAPSACTSHKSNLARIYPLIHSPSGDRRWAVRESSGRVGLIPICSKIDSCTVNAAKPALTDSFPCLLCKRVSCAPMPVARSARPTV